MDRRQRKSREAIFAAFSQLLSKKKYHQITVGEIIALADVGRATFYAHFETKDDLLKELCRELFCHIFDAAGEGDCSHHHIFSCNTPDSVFVHLFRHLKNDDHHILRLLCGENCEMFSSCFQKELVRLIENQQEGMKINNKDLLPKDFMLDHIANTFIQTVRWWGRNGLQVSPEKIAEYFLLAVNAQGASS